MSEEIQGKNTNKRLIGKTNLAKYKKLKIEYSGDVYIVPEAEMRKYDNAVNKSKKLHEETLGLKEELKQTKEELKFHKTKAVEAESKVDKVNREKEKISKELKGALEQLEQYRSNLEALQIEYARLKVFKENAGRGRQPVLSPEHIVFIKRYTLEGRKVKDIHAELERGGVNVSYETVRKIASEAKA